MADSTLEPLSNIENFESHSAIGTYSSNNDKIEAAFVKTLSREPSANNAMNTNLDMDGNRIINVGDPTGDNDVATKGYIDDALGGFDVSVLNSLSNLPELVQDAENAAAAAAASAIEAANYVGAAESAPNWTTGRTITLTGGVTGTSAAWDGSTDLSFVTTVPDGSITGAKLAAGAVTTNLGYTPASLAGAVFSGPVRLGYTVTSLTEDAAGFRGVPLKAKDETYVFIMDDASRLIQHTASTAHVWYVPTNTSVAFPNGTAIVLRNVGSGNVTISPDSGVTLRLAGSGTSGNKVLAQWGLATLIKEGTNFWILTGTGVSDA